MFKSIQMRARTVATLGVMAALVVGGVAAAQSGSSSGGDSGEGQGGQPHGAPGGPPPMMIGPGAKGLTYGELHVQKNGQSEVIRLDQGKIAAVDSDSISLTENDGSEVTIALDEDTKIMAGPPGEKATVDDLSVGQQVFVTGPEGEAAEAVMVAPKRGDLPKSAPLGGPMGPPPPRS